MIYAIPCRGIKNAKAIVEAAGAKILPSLCPEDEIHVDSNSIDEEAAKNLAATFGKEAFDLLVDGSRTPVATPQIRRMAGRLYLNKGKAAAATVAAAAAAASAWYYLA
jgi:hypothetical protein